MASSEVPASVRAAKWSFWILAAAWVVLGIVSLVRIFTGEGDPKMYMWIVMGLTFVMYW